MSVHIGAQKGEIAETILLPGDPLRAKWIAETYFKDPYCFNKVRGMYGYTGYYNEKPVSVMGSGMGVPSLLVYVNELINEYQVKNFIRVGSAGSYQKDVELNDIVIAMSASSNSGINRLKFNGADYAPTANYELFSKALLIAKQMNISFKAGNILSSDIFYEDDPDIFKKWADYGVLCVEMESAGLYTVAAKYGVRALTLLTISDSLVTGEKLSSKEREHSFHQMAKFALELI
ncbi:MAG: purine-nucleoside phosphorylase [Bacteroidota bacterium]